MRKARFIFRVITPARVIDGPNNKQGACASWPSITLPGPGEGEASCGTKVSLQFQQQTEITSAHPKGPAGDCTSESSAQQSPGWVPVLGVWGLI